jgi:hypothetical protein
VMRTLRDLRHMGSDECVTLHVPRKSLRSGAWIVALGVSVGGAVEGWRRVAIVLVVGGWEEERGREGEREDRVRYWESSFPPIKP